MIEIPKTPDYVKNSSKAGEWHPCSICGKAIKKPDTAAWLRTAYGSHAITAAELEALDKAGDSGCFPVGADCLRRHPELRPYVIARHDGASASLANLAKPDAETALALLFRSVSAVDLSNSAYLLRTAGRGKGGLGKWVLIVKARQAEPDARTLVSGTDWLYRSFIRGWSEAEGIEVANERLQRWLNKQAKAALHG